VAFIWRKGNFNALSPSEKDLLQADLLQTTGHKYGITAPPAGWTKAAFAALDPRTAAEAGSGESGGQRSRRRSRAPVSAAPEGSTMEVDPAAVATSKERPRSGGPEANGAAAAAAQNGDGRAASKALRQDEPTASASTLRV